MILCHFVAGLQKDETIKGGWGKRFKPEGGKMKTSPVAEAYLFPSRKNPYQ